ncbi:hypothetical protein KY349_03755 [Candidatus Woesearchaeota archaeon]|jgi:hypothetical protein|nr:hypothetical protein [Candidatus Woesearchaeota archaeon]
MVWKYKDIPSDRKRQKRLRKISEMLAEQWLSFVPPIVYAYQRMLHFVATYDLAMNEMGRNACMKEMEAIKADLTENAKVLAALKGLGEKMANSLFQRMSTAKVNADKLSNVCRVKDFQRRGWTNKFKMFKDFADTIQKEIKAMTELFAEKATSDSRPAVLKEVTKTMKPLVHDIKHLSP